VSSALLIVPHAPLPDGVQLWLGSNGPPPAGPLELRLRAGGTETPVQVVPAWGRVVDEASFHVARVELRGLPPDRLHSVHLPGDPRRAATFRTLPARLPAGTGDAAFVVLLGSCFSKVTGGSSPLGSAVRALPPQLFPHVKVLCGDQVYLDLPVWEDLPEDPSRLRAMLLSKYLKNWEPGESADGLAFGALLRQGATLFVSDDHEFWNNYPFPQAQLPITLRSRPRRAYREAAKAVFRGMQVAYPEQDPARGSALQRVRVGSPGTPGSFELAALDGRFFRDHDRAHDPAALSEVCAWLRGLSGPAALVLSQPLFDEPAGWFKRRTVDALLADFDDYEPLVQALDAAPHDVLLLSGDIHRARQAVAYPSTFDGHVLHEVVTSPLALIREGKHTRSTAHTRFPDPKVDGVGPRTVQTLLDGLKADNFATLAFRSVGGAVLVEVTYWTLPGEVGTPARRALTRNLSLY